MVGLTALVLAGVCLLNVAAERLEARFGWAVDMTEMEVTSFDEGTIEVLESLEEAVTVYTVFQNTTSSTLRARLEQVLARYQAQNDNIRVENVDPLKEPGRIASYADGESLDEGSLIVVNEDQTRFKVLPRDDYYYGYSMRQQDQSYTVFDAENVITSAIYAVTRRDIPKVYFLTEHGELDVERYGTWITAMLNENGFQTEILHGFSEDSPLMPGDILAIVDPQLDITDQERSRLYGWMNEGGRLLVNIGYTVDLDRMPNLVKLLDAFHLGFGEGYVEESAREIDRWKDDVYALVPVLDEEHAITAELNAQGFSVYMPYSRPILPVTFPEFGYVYTSLLTTSSQASVVQGGVRGHPGKQTIALAMQKDDYAQTEKTVRAVLLGGYNLLADTNMMYSTYNPLFLSSVFQWLANQKTGVSVRMRYVQDQALTIPNARVAWMLSGAVVVVLPAAVFAAGIIVWLRRRRR